MKKWLALFVVLIIALSGAVFAEKIIELPDILKVESLAVHKKKVSPRAPLSSLFSVVDR